MSKDIRPRNNKEQRHGYWEVHFIDGDLCYKRFYQNDKENGYEEYYWYNGKISKKRYYI